MLPAATDSKRGVTRVTASAFVPLWDRKAEWARRLAMIREARSFLYLSTFYLEYDTYGVELLDALDDAQARGVAVNLLIDGFGQQLGGVLMSRDTRAALAARFDGLRHAGGVVAIYRPAHRLQRWLGGGQHVKIQVSDAGEVIFGSSNVSHSSFEQWNEYSVALRGQVVATLLESYQEIGGSVSATHLAHLRSLAHTGERHIALDYWICNPNLGQCMSGPLGWRGRNVVTDSLVEMIDAAASSIAITSFYFKPVAPLIRALVAAARRGVRVDVYHSHRDALPATELAWIASAAHYARLLRAGVRIWENKHGEHSKIVVTDSANVAFGGYNFEHAAHDRLAEAMLVSRDATVVEPAVKIFEELAQDDDNVRVTFEMLRGLPTRLRVKQTLLAPFKRWM